MALYQIKEPPTLAEPVAVGIDFGTTNTLVAIATKAGSQVLPAPGGKAKIPSVVCYQKGALSDLESPLVGDEALLASPLYPNASFKSIKRILGLGPKAAKPLWQGPAMLAGKTSGFSAAFPVGESELLAEAIAARIIGKAIELAERAGAQPGKFGGNGTGLF